MQCLKGDNLNSIVSIGIKPGKVNWLNNFIPGFNGFHVLLFPWI